MKTNRKFISKCKKIVSKYQQHKKKRQDLNISIELPDNHFFNKMAQDGNINFSVKKNKKNKDKNYIKHLNRKDLTLSESQITSGSHFYETICKNNTLTSMPSTLRMMPLIPFWRSSFEIIGNQENGHYPPTAGRQQVSSSTIRTSQPLYVTMNRKIDKNEPIYV